ncbi:hypothetical protein MM300_19665 [Evansella sp. LMS18]|jgi:hypothetical protein|uniref:hypothetical protein n=1 Tax=Evansella sp. LMS18 TaxID=2924033 RepID=UPI0020D175EA|nr:hypothetical protein [Evansella sp. LMS18]UTR10070.1 hypothetical protein MM300_19665 [Evansella sp. LMS18]
MPLKFLSVILLLFIAGCNTDVDLASYSFYEETENWQVSMLVEEKPFGETTTEEAELTFVYIGKNPVPDGVSVIVDTEFPYRGEISQKFDDFEGEAVMPFGNNYFAEADRFGSPYTIEINWDEEVEEFIIELEKN